MPETLDMTGLPPEAVRAVRTLVGMLRERTASAAPTPPSLFDLLGRAPVLRTGDDIARQVQDERDAWGES
jgi:hypothetical protein